MKKFLRNLSLLNILGYFSIASITFLLGFSFQNTGFIKGKLKQIYLQSKYKEIKGPKKVACPQDSFVIAYFGQSNSAGYVKPFSKKIIPDNLIQFDWRNGFCYQYKEPLFGSEGRWGNSITDYAVLMANKIQSPVIIVPFGKGGSSIGLWAYGHLYKHYEIVLNQLKISNLYPKIFLWHQGESDARSFNAAESNFYKVPYFEGPAGAKFMFGTSTFEYERALSKIINKSKIEFPNSYFGVALTSRCGKNQPWEEIRTAQKNSIKLFKKVFISADSDSIYGKKNRYDDCHFSRLGAQKLSEMYFESTSKIFSFQDF